MGGGKGKKSRRGKGEKTWGWKGKRGKGEKAEKANGPNASWRFLLAWREKRLNSTQQSKTIFCHSERSEESLFLSRRDSSRRDALFRMT
jgi:hypothetical protein